MYKRGEIMKSPRDYFCRQCGVKFEADRGAKQCPECGSADIQQRWGCAINGMDSAPSRIGKVG